MRFLFVIPFALFGFLQGKAQAVTGLWQSVDHDTGEATSHVLIYEQNGKVYGKITKLLRKHGQQICDRCPGERRDKSLVDMLIIENLVYRNGYYQDGTIFVPSRRDFFDCKIWLKEGDPNTLVVRGSLGPFFKTQYWQRVE